MKHHLTLWFVLLLFVSGLLLQGLYRLLPILISVLLLVGLLGCQQQEHPTLPLAPRGLQTVQEEGHSL